MPPFTGTTCRTPRTASAFAPSNRASFPPRYGQRASTATSALGLCTSSPYTACPRTIAPASILFCGLPISRKVAGSRSAGVAGTGLLRGGRRQLAVSQPPSRSLVRHRARRGLALRRIHLPRFGGRRHQHVPRRRTRAPQRHEAPGRAAAAARAQADAPEARPRHRLFEPHLPQVHPEFLAQNRGQRGAYTLPHFRARHPQRHTIVRRDADVGVGLERRRLRARALRQVERQGKRRAGTEKRPPRRLHAGLAAR